jgi:hypothetical protein
VIISRSGSPIARRWRSRRSTCASRSFPGSRARPRAAVVLRAPLDRYGIDIVGGLQTIEPTVTNETESEALGCRCTRRPSSSSARRARRGRDRRVRPLDLPGDRYKLVTELNRRLAPRGRTAAQR